MIVLRRANNRRRRRVTMKMLKMKHTGIAAMKSLGWALVTTHQEARNVKKSTTMKRSLRSVSTSDTARNVAVSNLWFSGKRPLSMRTSMVASMTQR